MARVNTFALRRGRVTVDNSPRTISMDPTFANRVLRSPLILIQHPSAKANRSLALSLWPGRTFCANATEACESTVVTTGYASADEMQARMFEARTHRGTHAMSFCH